MSARRILAEAAAAECAATRRLNELKLQKKNGEPVSDKAWRAALSAYAFTRRNVSQEEVAEAYRKIVEARKRRLESSEE